LASERKPIMLLRRILGGAGRLRPIAAEAKSLPSQPALCVFVLTVRAAPRVQDIALVERAAATFNSPARPAAGGGGPGGTEGEPQHCVLLRAGGLMSILDMNQGAQRRHKNRLILSLILLGAAVSSRACSCALTSARRGDTPGRGSGALQRVAAPRRAQPVNSSVCYRPDP